MGDYTAQYLIDRDMRKDDIIAVTQTPERGWWHGEPVDEARRVPAKLSVFPRTYLCLV